MASEIFKVVIYRSNSSLHVLKSLRGIFKSLLFLPHLLYEAHIVFEKRIQIIELKLVKSQKVKPRGILTALQFSPSLDEKIEANKFNWFAQSQPSAWDKRFQHHLVSLLYPGGLVWIVSLEFCFWCHSANSTFWPNWANVSALSLKSPHPGSSVSHLLQRIYPSLPITFLKEEPSKFSVKKKRKQISSCLKIL